MDIMQGQSQTSSTLRSRIINKIRTIAQLNDTNKLSDKDVADGITFCKKALIAEFGSVKIAIRAAGLYPFKPDKIDLIRSLIQFNEEYHAPRLADAHAGLLPYYAQTYLRAFGTWNNALSAAGLEVNRAASGGKNRATLYGEKEIQAMILALQTAYRETGILPSRRVHDSTNPPFTARQYRRIGGWGDVAEAANLRLAKSSAAYTK